MSKKYTTGIIVAAVLLLVYLVWGFFGFAGAWMPGNYDAQKNIYWTLGGWGTGLTCNHGFCRAKFYTPFKKHGLIDTAGRVIVPFLYDHVFDMENNGLVTVKVKERYGVINTKNQMVVPAEYHYIRIQEYYIRASIDSIGGTQGMKSRAFDLSGNPIFPIPWLDYLITHKKDAYNTNLFLVGVAGTTSYLYFFDAEKMYLKNVRISAYYSLEEKAKEAHIMIAAHSFESEKSVYALMDKDGVDILDYAYDYIKPTMNDVFIVQQANKFGVFDAKSRDWVLPVRYLAGGISVKLNGHLVGTKKGNGFRYIDREGTVILSEKNQVLSFNNEVINFLHPNGSKYHMVYNEAQKRFYWFRGTKEIR